MTDFKISCAAAGPIVRGRYGRAEGWVTLEMERGRTEQEIALFNTLVDFAFYCGTGARTDEGAGADGEGRRGEGRTDGRPLAGTTVPRD